jgi:hypothetical protein
MSGIGLQPVWWTQDRLKPGLQPPLALFDPTTSTILRLVAIRVLYFGDVRFYVSVPPE